VIVNGEPTVEGPLMLRFWACRVVPTVTAPEVESPPPVTSPDPSYHMSLAAGLPGVLLGSLKNRGQICHTLLTQQYIVPSSLLIQTRFPTQAVTPGVGCVGTD
jgi:hypothetical protein